MQTVCTILNHRIDTKSVFFFDKPTPIEINGFRVNKGMTRSWQLLRFIIRSFLKKQSQTGLRLL